jgi:glycosyltransferase involved in cell wall biosynthesis
MATYNGETYLKEQTNSILNQGYDDWESYIHDDDSKDGPLSIK